MPAPIPFTEMTRRGSFAESRCPRLLSTAQKRQVSRMPSAGRERPKPPVGSRVRKIHDAVTHPSATQTRRLTHSPKTAAAISVVATASKFRRSAAVAAGVPGRLKIRVTGASTPPKTVTPMSQGISLLPGGASL
ncbi:hypothetical protein ES707_22440 [subsurface metagenome]